MKVQTFHHKQTGTLTHLLIDDLSSHCVLIDPVLDYEDGQIQYNFIEQILDFIAEKNLVLDYAMDTHIHADHLTANFYLNKNFNIKTVISDNYLKNITKKNYINLDSMPGYTIYVKDGDILNFGNMAIKVLATPGHTDTCVSYIVDENIFCGDLMFMPDVGCGRCDFENGDAETLFMSGNKILAFPAHYKIHIGHDYPKENENYRSFVTVKEQIEKNIYFKIIDKKIFKEKRELKDKDLALPRLFNESTTYNALGKLSN